MKKLSKTEVLKKIYQIYSDICDQIVREAESDIDAPEGFFPFFVYILKRHLGIPVLVISNEQKVKELHSSIKEISDEECIYFFPSSAFMGRIREVNVLCRSETLLNIVEKGKRGLVVASLNGIREKVLVPQKGKASIVLKKNLEINPLNLVNELILMNYEEEAITIKPGSFSYRGLVLDVFPWGYTSPLRIYFDDIKISAIRKYDIVSQLAEDDVEEILITTNSLEENGKGYFLWEALPEETIILCDFSLKNQLPEEILRDRAKKLKYYRNGYGTTFSFMKDLHLTPKIIENFKILNELKREGFLITVFCESDREIKRIEDYYRDFIGDEIPFYFSQGEIINGFIDNKNRLCVVPSCKLLNRHPIVFDYQKYQEKRLLASLNLLQSYKSGDLVIHEDYGICKLIGMKKIKINGKDVETICLEFDGNDILYVSPFSLNKITKYNPPEGEEVKLSSLKLSRWQKQKEELKEKAREIVEGLISVYASRILEKAPSLVCDKKSLREFENDFPWIETEDQDKAIEECYRLLENEKPTDHLICGDVGVGKTEVALRSAFKSVLAGKQVILLCPTTLLAFQHYRVFKERMEKYGVRVAMLSRLTPKKDEDEILQGIKSGSVNIIIGTHRLLQDDVKFFDPGLLIIDEEHLFGVLHKEKIRMFKKNIHVIYMTATPIPRTLQMALSNIKSVSYINTPLPGRLPVITIVHKFNPQIIRDAIKYELERGGQVFFIHNRIENLQEWKSFIEALIPDARVASAHGKMKPKELEEILLDFIEKKIDILVSTAIVEAGLDIPTVNTIIINNAHLFGLNQLHQLRGRIGRSNIQGFCYLIIPQNEEISQNAKKRLEAMEQFYTPGSGLRLSLIDLQMRGPGTLLGIHQKGFIKNISPDLFIKIMEETANEIASKNNIPIPEKIKTPTTQIETDIPAFIPDNVASATEVKIQFYQKISSALSIQDVENIERELYNRFGVITPEMKNLLLIMSCRIIASSLGIEKIIIKNSKGVFFWPPSSDSFYESELFTLCLNAIADNPRAKVLPQKDKLIVVMEKVKNLNEIVNFLEWLVRRITSMRYTTTLA